MGENSVLVHNWCGEEIDPRNMPGTVSGDNLPDTDTMMRGTHGNVGVIPQDIADQLQGKQFNNFDEFRAYFWETVGNSKYAEEFSNSNRSLMKQGRAPKVVETQQYGGRLTYELHHKTPIHAGGSVYDLNNLVIVTPRYHIDVLSRSYHYGHN